MYQSINTINDVIRERFLYGSELDGEFGFPKLPPVDTRLTGVKAVPFNLAQKERNPRDSVCHFFIDDVNFERFWNNPEKYFSILRNFRYVCTPDFSFYDEMPKAMKVWQIYRSRALGWWLHVNGFEVIPSVGWGSSDSFDYCFDGLSQGGTVAVSSIGCLFDDGQKCFDAGYREMIHRLRPDQVLLVGQEPPNFPLELVPVVRLDSFAQELRRRVSGTVAHPQTKQNTCGQTAASAQGGVDNGE